MFLFLHRIYCDFNMMKRHPTFHLNINMRNHSHTMFGMKFTSLLDTVSAALYNLYSFLWRHLKTLDYQILVNSVKELILQESV